MLAEQRRCHATAAATALECNTQEGKTQLEKKSRDLTEAGQAPPDQDHLKPTLGGGGREGGSGGGEDLTLSPQVSRFSQTRLRL